MNSRAIAIYSFISVSGSVGATCDEIAERLGYTPQQVGESLSEIVAENKVVATQDMRLTGLLAAPVYRSNWRH